MNTLTTIASQPPGVRRGIILKVLGLLLVLLAWPGPGRRAWAQCAAPAGLQIFSNAGGSAILTFSGPAGASSYSVSYTYPGGGGAVPVTPAPTGSPVTLSGLPTSTAITVSVTALCAGGQLSPTAALTFQSAVANDEPCTATPLPVGTSCTPLTGTARGATRTPANGYSLTGCLTGVSYPGDVWYSFVAPASGGISIATIGTVPEKRLFAAASCQGPFTELACVATTFPLNAAGLTPGTTYYVQLLVNPSSPQFTVCATGPPACAAPNNVAVGNLTATTAQVSFLPGPGNASYSVIVIPPGGAAPLTFPGTVSPIALTGLNPLTTYTLTVQGICAGGQLSNSPAQTFSTHSPQDEPAGAVLLPVAATCQPTAGTTAGATTTPPAPYGYTNPGCFGAGLGGNAPLDVWYQFQTAATGPAASGVVVTTTGIGAQQVRLFASSNGAAGPFTELGCAFAFGQNIPPPLTVAGLMASTTYFLGVSGFTSNARAFTVCLTPAPACPAPANLTVTNLTPTTAQVNWTVPGPTTGSYTVEYGPTGFAPGSGTLAPAVTNTTSATLTGLTANVTYQAYVVRDCGAAGPSTRSGPVSFTTLSGLPPANDDICAAAPLPTGGAMCQNPTTGTLVGATLVLGTNNQFAGCVGSNTGYDVWYSFTTPATGAASTGVALTVTGAAGVTLWAASACTGPTYTRLGESCVPFNQTTLTPPPSPLVVLTLTPNTTYYVQVAGGGQVGRGPFTLCRQDPPPCNSVTNLRTTFPLTQTTTGLSFAPGSGLTSYTVVVTGPGGFSQTQTGTVSPITLTGLSAATTYTATITGTCAGGQGLPSSITFTTLAPGPANSLCANAVTVTCGQLVTGTTVNATGDPNAPFPACGRGGAVFYQFTGTGDVVVASLCNPGTALRPALIDVYTGTCTNLSCVSGSLTGSITCSRGFLYYQVQFPSLLGVTYYLSPHGDNSGSSTSSGIFEMSVTCIPPACPAPGSVAVSSLTATSASVRFTPAAGSSSPAYTATAAPTMGGIPAVTSTATGSPITLTGLLPNTVYNVTVVANCTATGTSLPSMPAVRVTTLLASRAAALAATLGLFPNPAHHAATLTVPVALWQAAATLTLHDGLGRAVRHQTLPATPGPGADTRVELDLDGLPPGLYFVRLMSSAGPLTRQLLIE